MPLNKHFGGNGAAVMASMKKTYPSPKKAKEVFYTTENKRKSSKKPSNRFGGMGVK